MGAEFADMTGFGLQVSINPALPWIYLPNSSWKKFRNTIDGQILMESFECSSMYCYFRDTSCDYVKKSFWHGDLMTIKLGDMKTELTVRDLLLPGTILGREDGSTSCFLPVM